MAEDNGLPPVGGAPVGGTPVSGTPIGDAAGGVDAVHESNVGFETRDLGVEGYAATIPYYQVQLSAFGGAYSFGAAQSVAVGVRGTQVDVKALGTTTLWLSFDTPEVSCQVTQNLGFGDPCPLLLGQDFAGVVATQTTFINSDLPKYALSVQQGGITTQMPRMMLDGVDIAASVGNFATADWKFSGWNVMMGATAFSQRAWAAPTPSLAAVFVKHGNVYANIAGVTHRIQTARMSCNMARDGLKQLGTYEPYASMPTLPIRVEATVEAYPVGQGQVMYYATGNQDPQKYARPSVLANADIVMTSSEGFFGALPAHNKCTFRIPNAAVTAINQSGSVGAQSTITFSVVGYDLQYKSQAA